MKQLQRMQAVLLAVLLLVAQLAIPISAEPAGQMPAATAPYYGRWALSMCPNSGALLYAYDQIVAGVEESAATISVYNGTDPITEAELSTVYDAYRRDHVEHFWLGNSFQYSLNGTCVISINPSYLMEGEALTSARQAFASAAVTYLSFISEEMSDFDKELILHDRLAANVSYVNATNAHNAYGALVEGKAVCEGYAEALQYLYQCAGIQSFIATGSSYNPSTQMEEGHAWNYVKINGEFYQVDLTWNDQGSTLYHAYFNVTQAQILKDHRHAAAAYPLPACSATAANYFTVKGGAVTANECTVAQIVELFRNGGSTIHVFVKDDVNAFLQWYQQNLQQIVTDLQMTGSISSGCSMLGSELILTLQSDSCRHTSLTKVGAQPGDCTTNGNREYYTCSCGKWFADAAAGTEITDKSTVIVTAPGHSWTEKNQDADHLRARGENCGDHDTYWYGCSACDAISASVYFEGEQTGNHDYGTQWKTDGNGHFMECAVCHGEKDRASHQDADENGQCDVCLYVIENHEQNTEQGSEEITTGGDPENGTGEPSTEQATTEQSTTEQNTTEQGTTPNQPNGGNEPVGDISGLIDTIMENPTYLAIGGGCVAVIFLLILIAVFRRR